MKKYIFLFALAAIFSGPVTGQTHLMNQAVLSPKTGFEKIRAIYVFKTEEEGSVLPVYISEKGMKDGSTAEYITAGNRSYGPYPGPGVTALFRSPDARGFAYTAVPDDGKGDLDVYINGWIQLGPFLSVSQFRWSPDGQDYAVAGRTAENEWFIYTTRSKFGPFSSIGAIAWAPNSKFLACTVQEGDRQYLLDLRYGSLRKTAVNAFGADGMLTWSSQNVLAFAEQVPSGQMRVIQFGRTYKQSGLFADVGMIAWSPDGTGLAFTAETADNSSGQWSIVTDSGEITGGYPMIMDLSYADNGKILYRYQTESGEWQIMMGDEAVGPPKTGIRGLSVSADASRISFITDTDEGSYLTVGSERNGPFDSIGKLIRLTDDGSAYIFTASKERKWYLFSGDVQIAGPYFSLESFSINPEASIISYSVQSLDDNQTYSKVLVQGKEKTGSYMDGLLIYLEGGGIQIRQY